MRLFPIWIIVWVTAIPIFGRLGETESQCVQRYGDEIIVTDSGRARSAEFIKGDYVLVVTFLDGVSVCEAYNKHNSMFNDEEVKEIIAKNGGQNWKVDSSQYPRSWTPTDGSSEPGASLQGNTLVVWGVGGRSALALIKSASDAQQQAKAKDATAGL